MVPLTKIGNRHVDVMFLRKGNLYVAVAIYDVLTYISLGTFLLPEFSIMMFDGKTGTKR